MDTSHTSPAPPTDYVSPFGPEDACRLLVDEGERPITSSEAERMVLTYDEIARECSRDRPLPTGSTNLWRVREGFTLKHHAPKFGQCYHDFSYLQNWSFVDEPTKDSLVFWIPRIVPKSSGKPLHARVRLLDEIRTHANLPAHHLTSVGTASLLASLILAHHKATGERALDRLWVPTDTCLTAGYPLTLGCFGETGLHCSHLNFLSGSAHNFFCIFALGVEFLRR